MNQTERLVGPVHLARLVVFCCTCGVYHWPVYRKQWLLTSLLSIILSPVSCPAVSYMLCNLGLAHLLEHMAFKGTQRIGTKDYGREARLLDNLDEGAFAYPFL
jgi:Insulinase (Peptidase family M16)